MAQTRITGLRNRVATSILDGVLRPAVALHGLARRRRQRRDEISRILVIELWGIGDVVLSTPALAALRANLPNARVALLAKPHAEPLLQGSGLVDEIIPFEFPWTSARAKYSPRRYDAARIRALVSRLRADDYDLTIDAHRDVRSNLIAYATGASRRIGFDSGGGSFLLTDAVASGDQSAHKVADWIELLRPLGIGSTGRERPQLAVSSEERSRAGDQLLARGITSERPLLGVHPGASGEVRRWPLERYAAAVEEARKVSGAQVIVFTDETGSGEALARRVGAPSLDLGLRELMATLTHCDALLCADSGPMHIAAALGVPVIALFGPQRHDWYGPIGDEHSIVQIAEMPCRPCFDACRFTEAFCMTRLTEQSVTEAVVRTLAR